MMFRGGIKPRFPTRCAALAADAAVWKVPYWYGMLLQLQRYRVPEIITLPGMGTVTWNILGIEGGVTFFSSVLRSGT